jgi:hypothetical protein
MRRPDSSLTELADGRWPRFSASGGEKTAFIH